MAALRTEIEITAVDPSGDMVFVEGRGPGGVQLGLLVAAGSLPARVGQRIAVSIEVVTQAAAPSMRERMTRPTATADPRAAAAGAPAQNRTDVVLSAILGVSPGAERERDVDDEMDALFGLRK